LVTTIERFSEVEAEAFVARTCFKTGPPAALGVELEWLLRDAADPARPLTRSRLDAALAAVPELPSGRVSVEPGGQVELSSHPLPGLAACTGAVEDDLAALRAALASHDLVLVGDGLDPVRPPRRLLDLPRYAAMEAFFDRSGPEGRVMMCSTASVQVCVDAGPEGRTAANGRSASNGTSSTNGTNPRPTAASTPDFRARWRLLHLLAPVFVAAFANSPFAGGRPSGYLCGRQWIWSKLDASRTRSAYRPGHDEDPRDAWVRYVMSAQVLCVQGESADWTAPADLTFGAWLRGAGPRRPTVADLEYHLTTLFPPVRARGHLELRMVDAQSGNDWVVVASLITALLDDPIASDVATAAAQPLAHDPTAGARAARDALHDEVLAGIAVECFSAALGALDRLGAGELRPAVEGYAERYVDRGRCPADDRLDHWRRTGSLHLQPEAVTC